ncbi:Gfo/Idh/MocA family protein [Rhodopirellula sallentina]|uniref:NAD binding Rossmann fold oxidoreductase n=1 Tax=Rhodopirellula sallentina SM41 TaxID=1263870 RepID=M5U693_9BACT|nr:Gfo/Idh/MocA family oxidoreductase [Rhodopirellula sallentina]EMI56774.1 NAD binding Rossmann fold oxidoreductase [Rhodopirellula sallentina SM41]
MGDNKMKKMSVLMVGTGEYTTGFVPDAEVASDKKAGIVGTTLFDLRRRGLVDRLLMAGTNGTKFPAIRQHLNNALAKTYRDMDVAFDSYPADDVPRDGIAYRSALDTLQPGDSIIVFTPDDTHYSIAMEAIDKGLHVLVAKPIVKTVDEHLNLMRKANEKNVLVAMEVHKRWDPLYTDARDRVRNLGDFSFFQSYMSQPKSQLDTFRAWAGKSSDISYYLNAHHIDFNVWSVGHRARPMVVRASAATGVAHAMDIPTEDTITLTVDWENIESGNKATAIYTSSWIAPKADVHSQQRFFLMAHGGEVNIDQAHRGYSLAVDNDGFSSPNPLFMKFTPDADGYFSGQNGYGYRSIEVFLRAAEEIRQGNAHPNDFDGKLATANDTLLCTAILEAGRRSLDTNGKAIHIDYDDNGVVSSLQEL